MEAGARPGPAAHDESDRDAGGSDAELASAVAAGSESAARELVSLHWDGAYRAAYLITGDRYAAEDVAQEALLKVLASLKKFDASRPLAPWVHRIAANAAIDRARSEASRPPLAPEAAEASAPEREPDGPGSNPLLAEALMRLAPDDRAALVLRYVLDYTAPEVGEMLGLEAGAVRTRLHRATARVRDAMEATDG